MQFFDSDKKLKASVPLGDRLSIFMALFMAKMEFDVAELAGQPQHLNEQKKLSKLRCNKRGWTAKTVDWMETFGIPTNAASYRQDDIQPIATALRDYHIRIFTRVSPSRFYSIHWEQNSPAAKEINIALFKGNYDTFKPNRDTIGRVVCQLCRKTYMQQDRHDCAKTCNLCRRKGCTPGQLTIECPDCFYTFTLQGCFNAHRTPKDARSTAVCDAFKKCPICDRDYKPANLKGPHVCLHTTFCADCNRHVKMTTHKCCHIPPTAEDIQKKLKNQETFKIVFYDFETVVVETLADLTSFGTQWVNYVSYSLVCEQCYTEETPCSKCRLHRTRAIKHRAGEPRDTVARTFTSTLMFDPAFNNAIVMAHNGANFDVHFIVASILAEGICPEMIRMGSKIMHMTTAPTKEIKCNKLTFKDSCLFLPMQLSMLPKAFGIDGLRKGTYPYLANHEDNYGRVTPTHPPIDFYAPDSMMPEARKEFLQYYEENKNKPYNYDAELAAYCDCDVKILRQSIAKYISSTIEATEFNPIVNATTFSSFGFFLIKHKYMRPNQVGYIPELPFNYTNDRQSMLATRMLTWLEHTEGIQLETAYNDREHSFTGSDGKEIKLDGYHAQSRTAIEIHGCFYHSCPLHMPQEKKHPFKNTLHSENLRQTKEREQIIRDAGYTLRVYWEHTINEMLAADPDMKDFFDAIEERPRIRIREGLFGGRTQAFKLRATPKAGECIKHYDVNSLYPSVLLHNDLPEGAPKVYLSKFKPLVLPLPYRGMYLIDILPPQDLMYPIVPLRHDNRLFFCLCRTCAVEANNGPCRHAPIDRQFRVTITQPELEEALDHRYVVTATYEVWHWERWNRDLFRDYLREFVKLKWHSTGFDEGMTEDEKDAMLAEFEQTQGFSLEKEKMIPNGPMKVVSKAMCNSVWGRFCMKNDRKNSIFVKPDTDEFVKLMDDITRDVDSTKLYETENEDFLLVDTKPVAEFLKPAPFTNCVIACFTTAYGRIELFKAMHRLGDRLCYVDTDSAVFIHRPGMDNLDNLVGPHPRFWADEYPQGEIIDFVSTGAKSYSYRVKTGDTVKDVIKSKGVTLNHANLKIVNFDALCKLVDDLDDEPMLTTSRDMFVKKDFAISTVHQSKRLRPVTDKLRLLPDKTTLPYGWSL